MTYAWLLGKHKSSLISEEIDSIEQGIKNILFQWAVRDIGSDTAKFKLDYYAQYLKENLDPEEDRHRCLLDNINKICDRISEGS